MKLNIDELDYDPINRKFFFQGGELNSQFFGQFLIGFCEKCNAHFKSSDYCFYEMQHIVIGSCTGCNNVLMILFDDSWDFVAEKTIQCCSLEGDCGVQVSETEFSDFASIPSEYLDVVFTSAELRAMVDKYNNSKYSRQNLYRARKKYKKFKTLFNIKIDI